MNIKVKVCRIENLFCLVCDNKVSGALDELIGIIEYKTNLYTKEIFLKYNSDEIKLNDVLNHLKTKGFKAVESNINCINEAFMLIGYFVYKGYQKFFNSNNFYVVFVLSTTLQAVNVKHFMLATDLNKNLLVSLASLICYILGLYFYVTDEFIVDALEYLFLSIDILMYLIVSSLILSILLRVAKVNSYATTRLNKQFYKKIILIKENKFVEEFVEQERIRPGDTVSLSQGLIPFDCIILKGACLVDESDITGEDFYKQKATNDDLLSSTRLVDGNVIVKVVRVGKDSYTGKILSLIEDSSFKDNFCTNKHSRLFSPLVFLFSLSISLIFYFRSATDWEKVRSNAFKVFLISLTSLCPCVFVLSEPLLSLRTRKYFLSINVVITNYSKLFNKLPTVAFLDKTGTLTKAIAQVVDYKIYEDKDFNSQIILEMERPYQKTIYGSIYRRLGKATTNKLSLGKVEYISGGGLRTAYSKKEYRLGSKAFVTGSLHSVRSLIDKHFKKERVVYFSVQFVIKGYFILSDNLKESSFEFVSALKKANLKIVLLSGDQKDNVKKVSKRLKIPNYLYQQTSKDKLNTILNYQRKGESCLMVGDGTNDIPSFRAANLSISVNPNNTNSDLILLSGDLDRIGLVLDHLKKIYKKNLFNYLFAVVYNLLVVVYLFRLNNRVEVQCVSMFFPLTFIILNSLYF